MRSRAVSAALVVASVGLAGRASASDWLPANSSSDVSLVAGALLLSAGVLVTDVVLTVHDANLASSGAVPDRGWALGETVFGGLQTVGAAALFAVEPPARWDLAPSSFALIPATWMASLGVHGAWSLGAPGTRPSILLGGSYAVAADTLLTEAALRYTFTGRLPGRWFAVTELLLTAPQVVAASYAAATTTSPSERLGLGLLAGWSGALLLHGAASLVFHREPPPPETATPQPVRRVPPRFDLAPAVIHTATGRAPGVQLSGVF